MTVLDGFEDLKPKKILMITPMGIAICSDKDGDIIEVQLYVGSSGTIHARPVEKAPIDQVGARQQTPAAQRWAGVDQA